MRLLSYADLYAVGRVVMVPLNKQLFLEMFKLAITLLPQEISLLWL
jgi:hypothetical protein